MNILIIRSVVSTHIGYIVRNTINKFGDDSVITVITRSENASAMSEIKSVSRVITNKGLTFDVGNESSTSIRQLRDYDFDMIIVPVNGQLDSYDNIIKFTKLIWGNVPIYYHRMPYEYIRYTKNNKRELFKILLKVAIWPIATIALVAYIVSALPCFLKSKNYRSDIE
jgi:hypothetical protein